MKTDIPYKPQIIAFVVMTIVGILFNPMNILVYRFSDLYMSWTLIYSGLLMAANMVWAHEIINYLSIGQFNGFMFCLGIVLAIGISIVMREQILVSDNQWMKRMIPHHSTALTTSHKIYNKTTNPKIKTLALNIIKTQETEIKEMKHLLQPKVS